MKIKRYLVFLTYACILLLTGFQTETVSAIDNNNAAIISSDWLDEHAIHISKQGKFTETLYNESGDSCQLPCEIVMTETIIGEETKDVVITVSYDYSKIKEAISQWYWHAAFDRYTGQCFNITNLDLDNYEADSCNSTIKIGEKTYYVSGTSKSDEGFPVETYEFVIRVPVEYDGLVFQAGYYSDANREDEFEIIDEPDVDFINEKSTFNYYNFYFTLFDE